MKEKKNDLYLIIMGQSVYNCHSFSMKIILSSVISFLYFGKELEKKIKAYFL